MAPPMGSGLGFNRPVKLGASPRVTSISPPIGPLGGQSVTIKGTHFTGVTSVTVNGGTCTSVIVVDPETITCDVPVLTQTLGDVIVSTPTSSGVLEDGYAALDIAAWYRADLGVSIGATVTWLDQSGLGDAGRDLAQATTTGWSATSSDGAYNGEATVTVGTKALHSGVFSAAISAPFNVFFCGNYDGGATNELYCDDASGGARIILDENSTLGHNGMFAGSYQTAARTSNTDPKIVNGLFKGDATSKLFINSLTAGVTGNCGSNAPQGLSLGGSFVDTAMLVGKLAEFLIVKNAMSVPLQTFVMRDYMGARYGVTVT